jgi:cystathionine gamma-synthase
VLLAEHPPRRVLCRSARPSRHDVARRQMQDYGGMVSFTVAAGEKCDPARGVQRLFTLAVLGAEQSLIGHPAEMTHASAAGSPAVDPAPWLSVGIENVEDLVADLPGA